MMKNLKGNHKMVTEKEIEKTKKKAKEFNKRARKVIKKARRLFILSR